MSKPHWLGPSSAVRHLLESAKADRTDDGFVLSDDKIIFGLGEIEVVIPEGTMYYVNGTARDLAGELRIAGEGLIVNVL